VQASKDIEDFAVQLRKQVRLLLLLPLASSQALTTSVLVVRCAAGGAAL
jgi:hypothetical protein